MPTTIIQLRRGGKIEIGEDWTRVTLPNRGEVYGEPQGTEEQAATAADLGYGADVVAMVRDHDPLHALLADLLGLDWSYSMLYATGLIPPEEKYMGPIEEAAVIALQRYVCHLGLTVPEIARRNGYEVALV